MKYINIKAILFLLCLALVGSCEGGMGCSGCSGCGMEPIPGDFPLDKRVENGAQIHVTHYTIEFLEENTHEILNQFLPDGLFFEIPPSSSTVPLIGDVDICPDGGCTANVNVLNLSVTPTPPSTIRLVLQLQVDVDNLIVAIHPGLLCICFNDCRCSVDFNTGTSGRPYNSFSASLVMEIDTTTGYTAMSMLNAQIEDEIENGDINITNDNFCGLATCSLANLDFIKGFIIGTLEESLISNIEEPLNDALCRTCESGCPEGSECEGEDPSDFCRYPDETCVPMLLGLSGRMDMGELLSSFSPMTKGLVDFVAAAGGYAEAIDSPESLNLGMYGGCEGSPISDCVRIAPLPCENEGQCASGFTCKEVENPPLFLLPCRRCAAGCPEGSFPRDDKPCVPDPEDEFAAYDPSQPCMTDDETCVPIKYCMNGAEFQEYDPPGAEIVSVANALKVDQFTHCKYCDTDEDCTEPYTCDMFNVCMWDEFSEDCETATDTVMMVIGISRAFLKRFLYGMASSGALCLEIPPGTIPQLNSEMIVTALPTLGNLIWDNAPVALVLKPTIAHVPVEQPEFDWHSSPDIAIGDEPLLTITLRDVSIDFYSWIEETYSRFLSTTFDLSLGVDLYVRSGELTPIIRNPEVSDVRAYNNDLLPMDDESLRNTIGGLIELAMGFLPALDPIAIPGFEGFVLELPDGGVTHLAESGEDFLALYANLKIAEEGDGGGERGVYPAPVETSAVVLEAFNPTVDLLKGTAAMFGECSGQPSFKIDMSAICPVESGLPMEYRRRLNSGPWSRWSKKETEQIRSRQFIFQGRHLLEVQARLSGQPGTIDPTPARVELIVDGVPPEVRMDWKNHESIELKPRDAVSPVEDLAVSVRRTYLDGTKSDWSPVDSAERIEIEAGSRDLSAVEIRVLDEAGNATVETFEIRGRVPVPEDSGSDCMSCATVGSQSGNGPVVSALLALLLAALLVLRKKIHSERS